MDAFRGTFAIFLPAENIIPCDIHAEAMQFIDREIGVRTMISTHSPADFDLGRRFDVVFAAVILLTYARSHIRGLG